MEVKDCIYRLPCNWCDKYNRQCKHIEMLFEKENYEKMMNTLKEQLEEKLEEEKGKCECNHEWQLF